MLGVAIVLGLFLLVPFGPDRSAAVVPTTSSDPAPPTSGPQTWVLSSTVVAPGPTTNDPGADAASGGEGNSVRDSESLIIRVPVAGPISQPRATTPTTTERSTTERSTTEQPTAPSGTTQASATTVPASSSPCPPPQPSATSVAPLLGGDLGSTSGTGGETAGDCAG